ncbi:hypothetical protein BGY98DRAFT_1023836, partial [Russula aff. rugulosa BPL654]
MGRDKVRPLPFPSSSISSQHTYSRTTSAPSANRSWRASVWADTQRSASGSRSDKSRGSASASQYAVAPTTS